MIASFILGAVLALVFTLVFRLLNFGEKSGSIALGLTILVSFLWGNKIKAFLGLADAEIVLTEDVRPMKVYEKIEASGFVLDSISTSENFLGKTYIIEYAVTLKNIGDPIVPINDMNGKFPINFNEELVLRNLDGIEGKDEYINFAEHKYSKLFDKSGAEIVFSAQNPIKTNDVFLCKGKLELEKEDLKSLISRKHEAFLYLSFDGTTSEKYKESDSFGFIIKQEDYKVDLSKFLSEHPEITKDL